MKHAFLAVFLREIRAYFLSPLAYVFLSVYLLSTGLATWNLARFFDTAIASLSPFFQFQPWLLAIFVPAIGMRLWSEDLRSRTADLYFTSLRPLWLIHAAKFVGGFSVLLLALIATLPYWLAVNYLGPADNGVILANYLALAGIGAIFLLVALVFSALTQQQVIAFVLSTASCFALLTLGLGNVTGPLSGVLPGSLVAWIQGFSLLDGYLRTLRGTLLISDLIFSLGFAALLFALGTSILAAHRRLGQRQPIPWNIFTFVLLFAALPIFRGNITHLTSPLRLDVTADRLNTLSPAAADLARSLDEPLTLTLFYNRSVGRDYPEIRTHAERVTALLDAFAAASGGKIRLRQVDPAPFSAEEDLAITHGIQAVPTEGLDPLYFGLLAENIVDDTEVIPFLNPEQDRMLEFEIASLMSGLDQPNLPQIAIMSGIPGIAQEEMGGTSAYLLAKLRADFKITWLDSKSLNIPDDVDALLVIAPNHLSEYSAYQIDQFLLRKGRLILLADPAPLMTEGLEPGEYFTRLLSTWGVTLSDNVLADNATGLPVNVYGAGGTSRIEKQPLYPGPGPAQMTKSDFVLTGLQRNVQFGAPGWLDIDPPDDIIATPLIQSSSDIGEVARADAVPKNLSPARIRSLTQPLEGPVSIASRLSGDFPTAFPEGAPEPALPDDPVLRRIAATELVERPHLLHSANRGEVIVIADTDFLADTFYIQPQNGTPLSDNAALILSALDQFAGRPELAALRSRPEARRPMTRILRLRETAEAQYLAEQDKVEADILAIESQIGGPLSQATPELREAYLKSREKLRDLQRAFRSQINQLDSLLRFFTIWLPVGLSILGGFGVHALQRRRK